MATSLFGVTASINANVTGTLLPQSFVATAGQTLFTLTAFTYTQNTSSLLVFINGQKQVASRDFLETSSSSFTLLEGAVAGDFVDVLGFPLITDAASAGTLRSDLADATIATKGAGQVGFGYALAYAAGTVGAKLRQFISIKDFGAVGDGVSNDTAAWIAFTNYCASNGGSGYLPSGTYLIDPFAFTSTMAGLHLTGNSYNPMHTSFGVQPTIIKRRGTGGSFLTFSAGWNTVFDYVEIDGSNTSDTVITFAGGVSASSFNQSFNNCVIYGATITTGVVLDFTGTIQGDSTTFNHCNIHGYKAYDFSQNALSLVRVSNSNAFLIDFNECYFSSALKMFDFGSGSCSFYGCQFYRAINYIFYIQNVTQSFHISNCYTEQSVGVPFFFQAGLAGVVSNYPITIDNMTINATNAMTLNCQQNVRLINVLTTGNITITPMATYGTQKVYAETVSFSGIADFLGSFDTMLTAINTINSSNVRATKNAQPVTTKLTSLTYGASIAVDASLGNEFSIVANNGTAFTISSPTNISTNQVIGFRVYNTSGGVLGAVTWGAAYKLAGAWTSPGNLTSRYIQFDYQGGVWYERLRNAADVPI